MDSQIFEALRQANLLVMGMQMFLGCMSMMSTEAGRYLSYGFRCLLYMLPPKELALVDGDRVPNLIASHGIAAAVAFVAPILSDSHQWLPSCNH